MLVASIIFGLLFMIGFLVLTVLTLYSFRKIKTVKEKLKSITVIGIGLAFSYVGYSLFDLNYTFYQYGILVEGTVLNYCKTSKGGETSGVEFEYILDGKTYRRCSNRNGITLYKNQKYYVRVSNKYPSYGRIDLEKPVVK